MRKKFSLTLAILVLAGISIAQPVLTEQTLASGIDHNAQFCDDIMPAQGGAAWFDYNQDGWYDLYLTGGCGRDALYRNDGGTFTDVSLQSGINFIWDKETNGVTTGDVNRDGFSDILVTTMKSSANYLLMNNGDGTFSPVQWAGINDSFNSFSSAFGDLNLDGWLDLYICNWSTDYEFTINGPSIAVDATANFLYINNGDGTFTERASSADVEDTLGCSLGVLLTDIDFDQDQDIMVTNDFGFYDGNSGNRLFTNEYPLEAFSGQGPVYGLDLEMNGTGVAKADINLDGLMEYYISNVGNDKLLVRGEAGFEDEAVDRGIKNDSVFVQNLLEKTPSVSWGVAFMDLDNDMDEDLMVANGSLGYGFQLPALDSNRLYLNDGSGNFTEISKQVGVADTYVSRSLAYCDFNRDGNLDVFVGVTDEIDGSVKSKLYKNNSPAQNWVQIQCAGVQNNFEGIGTVLRLYAGGVMQTREIGGESSFNSQHWNVAHFGLGSIQEIDSVEVYWPGGGLVDSYYDLAINEFHRFTEGEGTVTGISNYSLSATDVFPNPFNDMISVKADKGSLIELFDAKGSRVMFETAMGDGILKFQTLDMPPGNYLARITSVRGKVVTRKLLKQ